MNPFSTIAMGCGSASHNRRPGDLHRRDWFRAAGLLGGASWLTLVAEHLARADDSKSLASAAPLRRPRRSSSFGWKGDPAS